MLKYLFFLVTLFLFFSQYNKIFAANGRFGVALGTWDYSNVKCYDYSGNSVSCRDWQVKIYKKDFDDMTITTYDSNKHTLSPSAFNISSFNSLDPNANTQFIWFHYEDINNPWVVTSGVFSYDFPQSYSRSRLSSAFPNEYNSKEYITEDAEIYALSGAPGSLRVRLQKEPGVVLPVHYPEFNRGSNWRIRLPSINYKNEKPYCDNCIFKEDEFLQYLQSNSDYNDGDGNWYAFYMLAETEYGIPSHYLEPYEYAAVLNTYVEKIKFVNSNARFILQSPVAGFPNVYKSYFKELYKKDSNGNLIYLSDLAADSITYNGLDAFISPPSYPDTSVNGYRTVRDLDLQAIVNDFYSNVEEASTYMYSLNGRQTLLTQTGVFNYSAVNSEPNTISFGGGLKCGWCDENADVWETTEYGSARLVQLAYSKLAKNVDNTHVAAWAYWGNMQQEYWLDPIINKTWGGLNHGIFWLAWPLNCTSDSGCPTPTNRPWPSLVGSAYLKAANGVYNYVPYKAQENTNWWPTNASSVIGDINLDSYVDSKDVPLFLKSFFNISNANKMDLDENSSVNLKDFVYLIHVSY